MAIPTHQFPNAKRTRMEPQWHGECCNICSVPFPEEGSKEACAAKHILAANKDTIGTRFNISGTKHTCIKQASTVALQTALSPHICGECQDLFPATKSLLGVKNLDVSARGQKTHDQMNQDIKNGSDIKRKARIDKYDKRRVYDFFHDQDQQSSSLPDYSALIHLDKAKRNSFHNMRWEMHGVEMTLNCEPRYRQATLGMLAIEYLSSETHLRSLRIHMFIFLLILNISV